jgi:hypothetical protein
MGFVHHQPGLVLVLDFDKPRQVGIVPVHAVKAFDDDHHALIFSAVGCQYLLEIVEVVMAEAAARGAGQHAADDCAVVDHGVADDQVLGARETGNDADIGAVAADEDDGVVDGIVSGQGVFQVTVRDALARNDAAGGAGNAVSVDRLLGGCNDLGMAVQSEIIVAGEIDVALAADLRHRAGAGVVHAKIRVLQPEFIADRALQAQIVIARQGGEIGEALVDRACRLERLRHRRRLAHRIDAREQPLACFPRER